MEVKGVQEWLVNLVDLAGANLFDGVVQLSDNLFGDTLLDVDIFNFLEHGDDFLGGRSDKVRIVKSLLRGKGCLARFEAGEEGGK